MTDLISALLHADAERIAVPPAPVGAVIAGGRRLRRRARLVRGGAVAAAVAGVTAVAVTAVVLPRADDEAPTAPYVATTEPALTSGPFGVDRTVHLGGGDAPSFTLPEDIHSLHYTSAGVVVRTNLKGGVSDGSGPEHFWRVTEGGVTKLPVTLDGVVPATSTELPYLAWSESRDGRFEVVLMDVATQETKRIPLPEGSRKSYWETPPLALDGDFVYAGLATSTLAVNWRTGAIETAPGLKGGMPIVAGGVAATEGALIDARTGSVLLDGDGLSLSPDGRFALRGTWGEGKDTVFDVRNGTRVVLDAKQEGGGFGWTPDGALFRPHPKGIEVCSPTTGACREQPTTADVPSDAEVNVGYSEICELRPGAPEPGPNEFPEPEDMICRPDPDQPEPRILKLGGLLYES